MFKIYIMKLLHVYTLQEWNKLPDTKLITWRAEINVIKTTTLYIFFI